MQDNVRNITTVKERYNLKIKREKGITLVALVITIVVLIILAGIAISMTVGENGIFIKAKEAKRLQITAEAKEKIGTDILDAQIEATQKNEQLQQSKVEEIIAKYGELQADGDTIKLKDNGYEISLKEIYNGTTSSSGGSTGGSTGSAELDSIKAELAQTNATEDKILKDYKVYSNGKLMTGTMEIYAGQTQEVEATSDDTYTYLSIPNAGYYGTDSKLKTLNSNLGKMTLLWHEDTTSMGNRTINIDVSKYKYIVIAAKYESSNSYLSYSFINVGYSGIIFATQGKPTSNGNSTAMCREVNVSKTGITFDGTVWHQNSYNIGSSYCLPVDIYGI